MENRQHLPARARNSESLGTELLKFAIWYLGRKNFTACRQRRVLRRTPIMGFLRNAFIRRTQVRNEAAAWGVRQLLPSDLCFVDARHSVRGWQEKNRSADLCVHYCGKEQNDDCAKQDDASVPVEHWILPHRPMLALFRLRDSLPVSSETLVPR